MAISKYLTMKMPNGEVWGVPTEIILRDRAKHYAHEFDGDIERSLTEDTIPACDGDDYNIEDWAVGNMNWSDFDGHQVKLKDADKYTASDFQDAWNSANKSYSNG